MRVARVDAADEELSNPDGSAWSGARSNEVVLSPVPLAMQPTEYVRVSREGRPYGALSSMDVKALHNGSKVFFRLAWQDETADGKIRDINQFADAAAVLFPSNGDAPLFGMGAKGQPVNAWFWRADWEKPKNVSAEGMGTTQRRDDPALTAEGRHTNEQWHVVVGRSLTEEGAPPKSVALRPGVTSKVAFAVWQGSEHERAGLKAFSPDWQELVLDT